MVCIVDASLSCTYRPESSTRYCQRNARSVVFLPPHNEHIHSTTPSSDATGASQRRRDEAGYASVGADDVPSHLAARGKDNQYRPS